MRIGPQVGIGRCTQVRHEAYNPDTHEAYNRDTPESPYNTTEIHPKALHEAYNRDTPESPNSKEAGVATLNPKP
jgi:hypothetical protein